MLVIYCLFCIFSWPLLLRSGFQGALFPIPKLVKLPTDTAYDIHASLGRAPALKSLFWT